MKAKIINFSTQFKVVSSSGSFGDYIGLQQIGIEFTNGDDYDFIIFSLSNINFFGGKLSEHTINALKTLKENKKPVICLFLDFKTFTSKIKNRATYPNLEDFQFEDFRDNWYLASFTRDLDKFKIWVGNQKNRIKFKEENIFYLNNMSFWIYNIMEPKENVNNICYIGNGRGGERNKFLSNFYSFDIYGRWKDKQKDTLKHNFKGILKQTEVKNVMNNYWGHIITYDKIGIDYKVDVTRLAYTLSAGCLPLIDKRLNYLEIPGKFNWLYIEKQDDINRILEETTEEKRKKTILELQQWIVTTFDKNLELNKIIGKI